MSDRVDIVYVGSQASVEVRNDVSRCWTFHHGKVVSVPAEIGKSLLGRGDFERPGEVNRPVAERHPEEGTITLRRWGALGDLVMFRAACAAFRRARPDLRLILKCQKCYTHLFVNDPLWQQIWAIGEGFVPRQGKDGGREFNLDRVAEADHDNRGDVDRVSLFLERLMDIKLDVRPEDWVIPVPPNVDRFIDLWMQSSGIDKSTKPLVGLQVRGSGPQKTVERAQLQRLAAAMTQRCNVVLIEQGYEHVWEAPGVYHMVGRDALHSVALLRRCNLCITPDSGVLWLAHAAKCPVLIFMGPRPAATRTNRHPLGPTAARAVQLNELVVLNGVKGCPPCLEQAVACGRKYSCIREQPDDVFVGSIIAMLDQMLGDEELSRASRIVRESWRPRMPGLVARSG